MENVIVMHINWHRSFLARCWLSHLIVVYTLCRINQSLHIKSQAFFAFFKTHLIFKLISREAGHVLYVDFFRFQAAGISICSTVLNAKIIKRIVAYWLAPPWYFWKKLSFCHNI